MLIYVLINISDVTCLRFLRSGGNELFWNISLFHSIDCFIGHSAAYDIRKDNLTRRLLVKFELIKSSSKVLEFSVEYFSAFTFFFLGSLGAHLGQTNLCHSRNVDENSFERKLNLSTICDS